MKKRAPTVFNGRNSFFLNMHINVHMLCIDIHYATVNVVSSMELIIKPRCFRNYLISETVYTLLYYIKYANLLPGVYFVQKKIRYIRQALEL